MIWLNGRLVDETAAGVSPYDRGFTLGDGVFETMRAYGGRVFRLDDHLTRLARAAHLLDLPVPAGVRRAVQETVRANGAGEAAVRLTLTRGVAPPGLRPPPDPSPTLAIVTRHYRADPLWYRSGVSAIVSRGRVDESALTAGIKRLGYLEAVLAQREADEAGADEALLLNTRGEVAEAAAANVFVVRDGVVMTPDLGSGALPGITRAVVLELCAGLGLQALEQPQRASDLRGADEAFLTSSLREIVPLVRLDGEPIGSGAPGPVTLLLLRSYREMAVGGSVASGDAERGDRGDG